jgi:hypothetical protein
LQANADAYTTAICKSVSEEIYAYTSDQIDVFAEIIFRALQSFPCTIINSFVCTSIVMMLVFSEINIHLHLHLLVLAQNGKINSRSLAFLDNHDGYIV